MPLKAYGTLSDERVSSAAERLAAKDKPKGRSGDVATTIKMRNKFAKVADQFPGVQFEDWLETQGYGLGDNGHAYKK